MQCPPVLFPLDINRKTTCLLSSKASDYADSPEGEDQGPYWIKVRPGIGVGIIRLSALPSRSNTSVNQWARGSSASRCSCSARFGRQLLEPGNDVVLDRGDQSRVDLLV